MQSKLSPYISFQGTAREAMEFYKTIFGGDAEVQRDGVHVIQTDFTAGDIHFIGADHAVDETEHERHCCPLHQPVWRVLDA